MFFWYTGIMTKTCTQCLTDKPLEDFYKDASRPDGRKWYCSDCGKAAANESYKKTSEARRKQINDRRKMIMNVVREIKEASPCTDCKINYPYYVMQFDHLRDKEFNIGRQLRQGVGLARVLAEIDKCDLVCANCHAKRSWERQVDRGAETL